MDPKIYEIAYICILAKKLLEIANQIKPTAVAQKIIS